MAERTLDVRCLGHPILVCISVLLFFHFVFFLPCFAFVFFNSFFVNSFLHQYFIFLSHQYLFFACTAPQCG